MQLDVASYPADDSALTLLETSEPTLGDIYMTPVELARRWRIDEMTLANHRSRGDGIPFTKLPSGGIRYKIADVLRAELEGQHGSSWRRLKQAVSDFGRLNEDQEAALYAYLKKTLR